MHHRCLLVASLLAGCYSIKTSAPPGTMSAFAASGEACVPVGSRRVHYALAGLIPINSNEVVVPANTRARVVTETDVLDVVLRVVGAAFTLGLYGGTQSATVELCSAVPGTPPPAVALPPPPPRIEIPVV